MNKKLKKVLNIASVVVLCIVFVIGLVMVMMAFSKAKDGIPRIFGVTTIDILTESMEGTIDAGDLAVIKKVDPSTLQEGDIITFWTSDNKKRILNTHQIVHINENGTFQTKGTNVSEPDPAYVSASEVVGKYQFRLRKMGYVVRFLQSGWGFFFVIMLPLILFFGYRVYVVVKLIVELKREKRAAEGPVSAEDYDRLKRELEELKARIGEKSDEPPPEE